MVQINNNTSMELLKVFF